MIIRNIQEEKNNVGDWAIFPADIIASEISEFLSFPQIKNLQSTCRFFYYDNTLQKKYQEKLFSPEIFAKGPILYFRLANGRVYALNSDRSDFKISKFEPMLFDKPIANILPAESHTFFVDIDGQWHISIHSQFPHSLNSPIIISPPKIFNLPNGNKIANIITGYKTSYINDRDGNFYIYGVHGNFANRFGEDTFSAYQNTLMEIKLENKLAIKKIVDGHSSTFFQDEKNQWNFCGKDITGTFLFINTNQPKKPIIDIVAGYSPNFICDHEGHWHGYGGNIYGETGLAENAANGSIITLSNKKAITKIVTNFYQTFFCDTDNHWHASGFNLNGMLGKKTAALHIFEPMPIFLENNEIITKIIAGRYHTLFLDAKNNWYISGIGYDKITQFDFNQIENKVVCSSLKLKN